jgi:phosphomethylpyrimidine synthase
MTDVNPARTKVYAHGERPDIRVPFTEVHLADSPGPTGPQPNAPLRLYDTSGPGSVPEQSAGAAYGLGSGSRGRRAVLGSRAQPGR